MFKCSFEIKLKNGLPNISCYFDTTVAIEIIVKIE